MEGVEIGLCGWNGSQTSYFHEFGCIEIQTTFYDPPALTVAEKWKSSAPPHFRFCIKAWQLITHHASSPTYRRLRRPIPESEKSFLGSFQPTDPVMRAWEKTSQIASALDAEIVLFQCPKSFLPTDRNLSNLCAFFRAIPRGVSQLAWEPRGEQWSEDIVGEICRDFGLIHCVDPFSNRSLSGSPRYWRLHGLGSYSYRYTEADLLWLRRTVLKSLERTIIMFNNFSSKPDAIRFRQFVNGE